MTKGIGGNVAQGIKYEFNGRMYTIHVAQYPNGDVAYSCLNENEQYPVFITTNNTSKYEYMVGTTEDSVTLVSTNQRTLIQDVTGDASDMDDVLGTTHGYNSVANALLYYMQWL